MLTSAQLTSLHRRQQIALRQATIRDLERLWPQLDWAALDRTYPRFATAVGALVARNRRTSAGLAAQYLRAFRVASGRGGDVRVVVPSFPVEAVATSLRVSSVVAAKSAAGLGVDPKTAMRNALTLTAGAMARHVLNAGRETITATGRDDPHASGWRWVLGGKAHCDYCVERAGSVFDDDAEFHSHDTCGCSPELVY